MEIGQVQRVSQLRFMVYNRPLHPELFEICHDHRVVKDGYDVQIWITGVSHMIGFYRGAAAVVQVIADADAVLPHRGKLMSVPFRGERDEEFDHADGIRYLASFQVERMSPRLYAKTHRELLEQAGERGLFVHFPQWTSNALPPFSHVDYEAKVGQLHVFAYHAFPEERTLIKTQSIFELT